jgi:hypothetical protein
MISRSFLRLFCAMTDSYSFIYSFVRRILFGDAGKILFGLRRSYDFVRINHQSIPLKHYYIE